MRRKRMPWCLVATGSVLLILSLAGCGGSTGGEPATLPAGGVFPIPLYPKGTMQDTIIGTDEMSTTGFDSQSWWLDYSGSPEDVIAYYEQMVASAKVDRSPEETPSRWSAGCRRGPRKVSMSRS